MEDVREAYYRVKGKVYDTGELIKPPPYSAKVITYTRYLFFYKIDILPTPRNVCGNHGKVVVYRHIETNSPGRPTTSLKPGPVWSVLHDPSVPRSLVGSW